MELTSNPEIDLINFNDNFPSFAFTNKNSLIITSVHFSIVVDLKISGPKKQITNVLLVNTYQASKVLPICNKCRQEHHVPNGNKLAVHETKEPSTITPVQQFLDRLERIL
jgi:hypothetical protein